MQTFEFHFNPKNKKGIAFDSFCYEPENIREKKLGSLYIVGEIALSDNSEFLNDLAQTIKKQYYQKNKPKPNPEKNLKSALKKANNFLQNKIKERNVDWINNLNFAVLNLVSNENEELWKLNFTKTGDIKIFLIRQGQPLNISQNLEAQKINSHQVFTKVSSNKVLATKKKFGNIATGQLSKQDKLLILTNEVFSVFEKENILEKIASLSPFEEKGVKKIVKKHKKVLSKISGVFLLILLDHQEEQESISYPKKEIFTSLKPYSNVLENLRMIKSLSKWRPDLRQVWRRSGLLKTFLILKNLPHIIVDRFTLFKQKAIKIPAILKKDIRKFVFSKNLILILVLILILTSGSFIFGYQRQKEIKKAEIALEQIKTKIAQAESFLIIREEEQAKNLFREAWEEVLPFTQDRKPRRKEALSVKISIEAYLDPLNKIERIEEPIISSDFDENKFLSKKTSFLKENVPENFEFNIFCDYNSNLYALDGISGEIIKYPSIGDLEWEEPYVWTKSVSLVNAKFITIDGSIWVLNSENKIDRYHLGEYQETLELNIFPDIENPEKIWTSPDLPYLYILEPCQNRIIIINKTGEIIKQFISEKFDCLLDFAISDNGETIWLLNDAQVYKIEF